MLTAIVIPNWNGIDSLPSCLDSLRRQTTKATIIVVDNGSIDGSLELIRDRYPDIVLIPKSRNLGFAGGVNEGIRKALEMNADYVALFNNDATADQNWLAALINCLEVNPKIGIATCKLLSADGAKVDSTGEIYTHWGLPYPRSRGKKSSEVDLDETSILAASGGASLYRVSMLKEIGLFDEDFFAYYEDVDISIRAHLEGWGVAYVATATAYHETGTTSSKVKGFTTYQTIKNLPWLLLKNVPTPLLFKVLPRLALAQTLFIGRAVLRGHGWYALKALAVSTWKLPKKLVERRRIQSKRKVTSAYIWSIMTHDLPPNAHNLRKLRALWWKLTGRKAV